MPGAVRAPYERFFDFDFGKVRVHSGEPAFVSAQDAGGSAYTIGSHIVLGRQAEPPSTAAGRQLLAHELAHVVQQSSHSGVPAPPFVVGDAADRLEAEADRASRGYVSESHLRPALTPSGPVIRRAPPKASAPPAANSGAKTCQPASTALPIEIANAKATLDRGLGVEHSLQESGAAFWFAHLYTLITDAEIRHVRDFSALGAPFVMHFIPVFYDLYASAAAHWLKGESEKASDLWRIHFSQSEQFRVGLPSGADLQTAEAWAGGIALTLQTGVAAHIQGDMANALVTAYQTYADLYCDVPPFDAFEQDFMVANKPIFEEVSEELIGDVINRGAGFGMIRPTSPEVPAALQKRLGLGLSISEIWGWRRAAWDSARSQLQARSGSRRRR